MEPNIEISFEKWRRTGNSDALADVFDVLAPRLLRVAIHMVGDVAAAEDLVQSTFVAAIEAKDKWDATRRLEPWFVGILDNRAKVLRREDARSVAPAAKAAVEVDTPLVHAVANEQTAELAKAIDRLDEPYRATMLLSTLHGMEPAAIAHALRRSPGAVRVQLHRGREMLRALLPAGIAGSLVTLSATGQGVPALKAAVLAHAQALHPQIAASLLGPLIGSKRFLIAASVVIVICVALGIRWVTLEPDGVVFQRADGTFGTGTVQPDGSVIETDKYGNRIYSLGYPGEDKR